MNENNSNETIETAVQTSPDAVDVPTDITVPVGDGRLSVSGGNSPGASFTVTSGDAPDWSISPAVPYTVSAGDFPVSGTLVQPDYTEILENISDGVSCLNSVVALLFFFLLLSWTQKKISTAVVRISQRERK